MKSMVEVAHDFLNPVLHKQAVCVDATLGTGRDTDHFLSFSVKKVYAFEIQSQAIERYMEKGIPCSLKLIHCGHEKMDLYVNEKVDAMIFNFGYCPGLDPEIVTLPDTSLEAVQKGIQLLRPKGRLALVFYPHPEGQKEADHVSMYCKKLDPYHYAIHKVESWNQTAPWCLLIEKRK